MEIRARRLQRGDLPERVEWFNDESVCSQMTISGPFNLEDTEAWLERNRTDNRRIDLAFEDQTQTGGGGLVAMGGLVDIDLDHCRAEIYLVVKPKHTGRGIGTAVV